MLPPRATCCDPVVPVAVASEGEPVVNDDWNRHWSTFGDAVAGNPATSYRSRLILKMLGPVGDQAVILEIGCGQGELALHLARLYPQAEMRGIDSSTEGVRRAALTADALGLSAQFAQRDLMVPGELSDEEQARATMAICSEVLEHVDEPGMFLRHAAEYLAPGCRLVITVPGGPRSAFDRHIGHRRHFTAARLRRLLETNGFERVAIQRAGFPFFNLYRLVVILRGKRLVADVEQTDGTALDEGASGTALRIFDRAFRYNLDSSPFGWQLLAVAHRSPRSKP
jgi:2-polyprenyl-3-methyl-5-hydroxy-6-metoxy-1,4-benzoquinol methylase